MKLEKFDKYKKQKRIAVAAVIGLFLFIGGMKLYKTFAYYEEKKTFNIIKGRVPDFRKGDIKFAVLLDNVESTTIPTSGYKFSGYECNKPGVSVKWSFEEWAPVVKGLIEKGTYCTLKFTTDNSFYGKVALGDYIAYTPSSTSYTILASDTGYTSNQTINPSELNLWRVIRKNSNGTVDAVSEYVSNTEVYFYGKIGYEKYIGTLNTIANAYETPGITIGSRHMGFNGQTESVTVSTATKAPWTTDVDSTNSPNGSARERAGGGDYGYFIDYELVTTVLGTRAAQKRNTTMGAYWLATRFYHYSTGSYFYFIPRYIAADGVIRSADVFAYRMGWQSYTSGYGLRPIIVLGSELSVTEGTKNDKKLWTVSFG